MDRTLGRMWFGAAGGLLAWSAHLVLGYMLITALCEAGESRIGAGPLNALYIALTVALAVVGALAVFAAWRTWRDDSGWRSFMGIFGVLISSLSLGTILLGGTQPLALPPCA